MLLFVSITFFSVYAVVLLCTPTFYHHIHVYAVAAYQLWRMSLKKMHKGPRTQQMKLQKKQLSSTHYYTFFSQLQQFFKQFYIWTTIFTMIFLQKLWKLFNVVVCEGLKGHKVWLNFSPYAILYDLIIFKIHVKALAHYTRNCKKCSYLPYTLQLFFHNCNDLCSFVCSL